jgi:hypothetical protein
MQNHTKFLYFCTLNFICVSSILPMNYTVIQTNSNLSHHSQKPITIQLQHHTTLTQNKNSNKKKSHPQRKMMKKEREEKNNIILNDIRDKIDQELLGIDKDSYLRGIRGTATSLCKSLILTDNEVLKQMRAINYYYENEQNKKDIESKLIEKHWYVNCIWQRYCNLPRFVETKSDRFRADANGETEHFILTETIDILSEKLYNDDLDESEIDELVKQGANVNYKGPAYSPFVPSLSIPLHFARNKKKHAVKNMQKIIDLGARLHDNPEPDAPYDTDIPLTLALAQNNYPMVRLLVLYEKPETDTPRERRIREYLIKRSFKNENFETIKLLLERKLITIQQGLDQLIKYKMTDQEIIHYLMNYNPA